jgi:hypothetical protein
VSIVSYQFVLVFVVDDKMLDEHNYDDDELDFVPILASSAIEEILFIRIKKKLDEIYKIRIRH